jgi:hypothetical protein
MRNVVYAAGLTVLGSPLVAQDLPQCDGYPEGELSYTCACPAGSTSGTVWGDGPYTADSHLCAAAVHAGVIDENGGPILALAKPGRDSYAASEAHGIQTQNWGAYGTSLEIRRPKGLPVVEAGAGAACVGFPADQDFVECSCPEAPSTGSLWGSDPYTLDSDLCAAARHVGYIEEGGGIVRAIKISGLDTYLGTEANGITSSDWSSYSDSFVFDWNHE